MAKIILSAAEMAANTSLAQAVYNQLGFEWVAEEQLTELMANDSVSVDTESGAVTFEVPEDQVLRIYAVYQRHIGLLTKIMEFAKALKPVIALMKGMLPDFSALHADMEEAMETPPVSK